MSDRTPEQMKEAHERMAAKWGRRDYPAVWTTNAKKQVELSASCERHGCQQPAVRRIIVNIWGCAYEFDVCGSHSEMDGCLTESF